jgi:hypothetical protein
MCNPKALPFDYLRRRQPIARHAFLQLFECSVSEVVERLIDLRKAHVRITVTMQRQLAYSGGTIDE